MKKILLFAAMAAISMGAAAQSEFLPEKGSFSTEIQFNPFSNDYSTFKIDQLKVRYMLSDKAGIRAGIGFGMNCTKTTPDPEKQDDTWTKGSNSHFNISLGYERHFLRQGRIDLYAGAGPSLELGFASSTESERGDEVEIENKNGEERAYTKLGLDVFTGIEFYVYRGLFVGAELGVQVSTKSIPAYIQKDEVYEYTNSYERDKRHEFSFGTYCVPALRLGWTF